MELYQINPQIEESLCKYVIDEETGEILSVDVTDELDEIQIDKEIKAENTALFIKNKSAEIVNLKSERDNFTHRIRVAENQVENAKKYLEYITDGNRFSTSKCQVSFRNTKAVEVVNEAAIPEAYKVTKSETRIDKRAIKMAFDDDITVPGAVQVVRKSVIIK